VYYLIEVEWADDDATTEYEVADYHLAVGGCLELVEKDGGLLVLSPRIWNTFHVETRSR